MTTNATTKVLCVRRVDWERVADGHFRGWREGYCSFDMAMSSAYSSHLHEFLNDAVWLDREFAEQDASHKQLIPYVLIRYDMEFLHYRRGKAGGESRLHGLRSVGVGGHVDYDPKLAVAPSWDHIFRAAQRELAEEMTGWIPDSNGGPSLCGFVNSEETPVNRVHLGIVMRLDCRRRPKTFAPELADPQWDTLAELRKRANGGEFEEWSRLVLEGMER